METGYEKTTVKLWPMENRENNENGENNEKGEDTAADSTAGIRRSWFTCTTWSKDQHGKDTEEFRRVCKEVCALHSKGVFRTKLAEDANKLCLGCRQLEGKPHWSDPGWIKVETSKKGKIKAVRDPNSGGRPAGIGSGATTVIAENREDLRAQVENMKGNSPEQIVKWLRVKQMPSLARIGSILGVNPCRKKKEKVIDEIVEKMKGG